MAEATTNNAANVSVGKGVAGGYAYSAPIGTTAPTDIETDLDVAFVNLGLIGEDGITNSIEEDTENIVDMNGDTVLVTRSSREETYNFILIETKKNSLAEKYGYSNVTDADGVITAKHNAKDRTPRVYVFEMELTDGRRQRTVIPNGKVTEVGETVYNSTEAIGYEVTVTCSPDANGDSVIDYIESTETEASEG